MPDILTDIVLREADVEIVVAGQTISMGRVFDVNISPKPVVSKKDFLGRSELKGFLIRVDWDSNQNSNDWLRELTSYVDSLIDVKIKETYTNKVFPFSNVYLAITPDINFNLGEQLISYSTERYFTLSDWISLIPPAGDYVGYFERYNYDFSMESEEATFSITAITKTTDPSVPTSTGYRAIITTNAPHGFIGNKLINVTVPADSYYNGYQPIKVISPTQFWFPISSSAGGSPSLSGAICKQSSFTIYARIDSKLIVKSAVAGYHDCEVWIRNYLLPEDYQSGDYAFKDHAAFKTKTFHIQSTTDQADSTISISGWGIGGMAIQSTLDVSAGTSWQLLATASISAANYALLTGAYS